MSDLDLLNKGQKGIQVSNKYYTKETFRNIFISHPDISSELNRFIG